ncbi:MAG: DNA integrity scanning protein DisA nucleotide-binding domain protein [Candidatus Brocadiia bacterium]
MAEGTHKPDSRIITESLVDAGLEVSRRLGVAAILVYADAFEGYEAVSDFIARAGEMKAIVVTRDAGACASCEKMGATSLRVPDVRLTRVGQVKVAVLLAASRRIIGHDDRVLCLSGIAKSGVLDSLFVASVGEEFELFAADGTEQIPHHVRTEVFERVLDLAIQLGAEGREGRPVGTIFVLGDTDAVLRHSEQLILNPFRGYPKEERNILDPELAETVKEFSTLDGAFLIREDGTVETAGCYLRSTIPGQPLRRGLGARHKSAAAVTAATDAVSITVSESTGNVTVYENGKMLFEIEKPLPTPSAARGAGHVHEDVDEDMPAGGEGGG